MVNRRQVIKSAAAAAAVLAMPKYASASSAFTGFYPAGNWIPAKQAMIQVYPRPDSETSTWARHRWAYYDGANPVQYKIPLGVSFGAFPYVYTLQSGPPGMTIGATYWQSGWSFAQAAAAGYGYLLWTPTASVSGATVQILVTDQQMNTLTITFTVSTSSTTSRFIFLDAVHGNDSTGTGSISAPWQTFTKAFGSTYAASANGGAICYFRQGTYAIPAQSDSGTSTNLNSFWVTCQLNTTRKPSALIGFPGDTPPVLTMTSAVFGAAQNSGINDAEDLFMQGLNPNGYNTSQASYRFVWATQGQRLTFDQIQWTNSGYGASAGSNATGYFMDGAGGGAMKYIFINSCSESNRQSGNAGNNYGGCSFYTASDSMVQGCSLIQPALTVDEAWQPKSDVSNSTWRGNTTIVSSCQYCYSPLQAIVPSFNNFEICYNIFVGGGQIAVPVPGSFPYGTLWCYRNSVQGNNGLVCGDANANGPYVFDSNATQGGSLPSGSSVQTDGLNLTKANGLLDSNGNLTSTYASYLGTVGAQISLASSSALTPNAPANLNVS
jgi:hypothetical protein